MGGAGSAEELAIHGMDVVILMGHKAKTSSKMAAAMASIVKKQAEKCGLHAAPILYTWRPPRSMISAH
jgi:hypothetical protein